MAKQEKTQSGWVNRIGRDIGSWSGRYAEALPCGEILYTPGAFLCSLPHLFNSDFSDSSC